MADLPQRPVTGHLLDPDLRRRLAGAVFPLDRAQLVAIARENEAPRALLTLLEGLPETRFDSYDAVEAAISREPTPADFEAPIGR